VIMHELQAKVFLLPCKIALFTRSLWNFHTGLSVIVCSFVFFRAISKHRWSRGCSPFVMRTKENTLKFDWNKAKNYIYICGYIIRKTFSTTALRTLKLSFQNCLAGSLINYAIQNSCLSFHGLAPNWFCFSVFVFLHNTYFSYQ
jgi:hypothetical protein